MSRSGSYGQSFAMKKLSEGKTEEALLEADKAVAAEPDDPEALLDRAEIKLSLRRWEEGLADVKHARELDQKDHMLDDDAADDLTFSSLVDWGKELAVSDKAAAQRILDRYTELFPDGTHKADLDTWKRRFGGEERTSWTKTR